MSRILLRRGNKADLPTLLPGEPGIAVDTKQLFVGTSSGNVGLADIISGGFKIQSGSASITIPANAFASPAVIVTFPSAFSSVPIVIAGINSTANRIDTVEAFSASATGVNINAYNNTPSSQTVTIAWIAIGN